MARKVTQEIIIDKEPHSIYFYIADPKNLPFWSDVREVTLISGQGETGSVYKLVNPTLFGSRSNLIEITKNVGHEHFAFRDKSVGFENETGFILTKEAGGGTKIIAYQEVGIGKLISLLTLNFLSTRDSARTLKDMLDRLKLVLDA